MKKNLILEEVVKDIVCHFKFTEPFVFVFFCDKFVDEDGKEHEVCVCVCVCVCVLCLYVVCVSNFVFFVCLYACL